MVTENPMAVFDFTAYCDLVSQETLNEFLINYSKKWCYQKEQGEESGKLHWQGRISLKVRKRFGEVKSWTKGLKDNLHTIHWSLTSNENTKNDFYVMKEDTRVAGPWSSEDIPETPAYIPRQYRDKMDTLRPFQEKIKDLSMEYNDRTIHYIYCENGNKGKSTIANLMRIFNHGIILPPINDADKLVFSACNILMAKKIRNTIPIFIDLPRAMNQERLYGIFSAIEVIKSGYVYDTRNHYKDWDFDSPNIFVFSNIEPELSLLSRDRWIVWTIDDDDNLVRFKAEAKPPVILIESEPSAQSAQGVKKYFKKIIKNIDTDCGADSSLPSDSE